MTKILKKLRLILASILNLGLAFHSKKTIFAIPIYLIASAGNSATWQLEPANFLTEEAQVHLRARFPNIESPSDLQRLILDISHSNPTLSLVATSNENQITIRATRARKIGDISITSTSYAIESELSAQAIRFFGTIDSPETRSKIEREIKQKLKNRGYYKPAIEIKSETISEWIQIKVHINEDYPCRIRQVTIGFNLPDGVNLPLGIGDVCDINKIDDAIESLEDELSELGFNQRKILNPEIYFDPKTNSALLVLPGTLGQKITYKIDSPIRDIFNQELTKIDPLLEDPSTMAAEISRSYKAQGYDDVKVPPPKKTDISQGEVKYTFSVEPGPKYSITNIEFQGATAFSEEELRENLGLSAQFGIIPLDTDSLKRGIDKLKEQYNLAGYWDAEINFPRITKNSETGSSQLVFIIAEGKQRIFKELIVSGNNALTYENIIDFFPGESNTPLSWDQLVQLERSIKKAYYDLGYLYANFRMELVQDGSLRKIQIRIVIKVEENSRVKFGETSVSGLLTTHEMVVRRELRFQPGDWYDPSKLEATRKALSALGIFASVEVIRTNPNSVAERQRIIPHTIKLREGKPGAISFGPGWSLVDGARYVIESSYSNIGGWGRKVFSKAQISEESSQTQISNKSLLGNKVGLGFMEPYVFDIPVTGLINLNHKAEAGADTWEISKSGELTLSHDLRYWMENLKISAFYGQEITRLERKEAERKPLIETGSVRTGRVGVRVTTDQTNNISWPTAGFKTSAEGSWARFPLGGNLRYFRWNFKHSFFIGIAENWVLAFSTGLTSFQDIDLDDDQPSVLPTSERLHAGGAETNRGFEPRTLGPYFRQFIENDLGEYETKAAAESISGGSSRGVYKMEVRHQLIPDSLAISVFLDSSNVYFSNTQMKTFEGAFVREANANPNNSNQDSILENYSYNFTDIISKPDLIFKRNYISYGIAANILTPLGSVDLSYGIPYRRCVLADKQCVFERGYRGNSKLESGVAHISIGASF